MKQHFCNQHSNKKKISLLFVYKFYLRKLFFIFILKNVFLFLKIKKIMGNSLTRLGFFIILLYNKKIVIKFAISIQSILKKTIIFFN